MFLWNMGGIKQPYTNPKGLVYLKAVTYFCEQPC